MYTLNMTGKAKPKGSPKPRRNQYKKSSPKLTIRQRAVVEKIASGMSPTRAMFGTYSTQGKATQAGSQWAQLKNRPQVKSALLAYSALAEETIIDAITDYKRSDKQWERSLAVETSKWLHDKNFGKAVQQNTNVNLNFTSHAIEKKDKYGL